MAKTTTFNSDVLNMIPLKIVANAVYALVDRNQDERPEVQAAASCAYFLAVCERFELNPQEVFISTKNIMVEGEGRPWIASFRGMKDYMKEEY